MKTFKGFFKAFILIACFIAIFFFRNEATGAFLAGRGFVEGLFSSANYRTLADLKTENASLKKELEKFSVVEKKDSSQFLEAHVYSRYPFNDKNVIVIDKGFADGVTEGMPVLVQKNVLLGKVKGVQRFQSEVITIFDPDWKTSASIGNGHIKTVLNGANTPHAELIPKDATVAAGDEVVNSAQDFPLGLLVGTIKSVALDEKKVWQIADIEVPYAIEDIDSVLVMTNFK